jgi:hypothetical protein
MFLFQLGHADQYPLCCPEDHYSADAAIPIRPGSIRVESMSEPQRRLNRYVRSLNRVAKFARYPIHPIQVFLLGPGTRLNQTLRRLNQSVKLPACRLLA